MEPTDKADGHDKPDMYMCRTKTAKTNGPQPIRNKLTGFGAYMPNLLLP
jgi:hypothetical protein